LAAGGDSHIVYVIGLPPEPAAGAPWRVVAGTRVPGAGEAVIDRYVADASGLELGSSVAILGRWFRIAGLTEGTLNIVNSVAFISMADFVAIRGSSDNVSYLVVKTATGRSPEEVAAAIDQELGDVTALSRADFSAQEREVISGMTTDIVAIMNAVGLLIGLSVMALTVYTAILARRAEYGVLKAVGARSRDLYVVVVLQAAMGLVLGLTASVVLTWLLSLAIPLVRPSIALELSTGSIAKVGLMALVIATAAAILPVMQMARLDPSSVFRRRVA
jgi:putative ABC transport system permease protein